MPAREIRDDKEYRRWVALHPAGYVLNTGADAAQGEAVLHKASCPHIADHKTGELAGKVARKFVAESRSELRSLAQELGRPLGRRWETCRTCGG